MLVCFLIEFGIGKIMVKFLISTLILMLSSVNAADNIIDQDDDININSNISDNIVLNSEVNKLNTLVKELVDSNNNNNSLNENIKKELQVLLTNTDDFVTSIRSKYDIYEISHYATMVGNNIKYISNLQINSDTEGIQIILM